MATTAEALGVMPGPPAQRVLGWQGNLIRFNRDPLAYLQAAHERYGPVTAFVRGSTRAVCAFGPEYNHQILTNPALFHTPYEQFICGDGAVRRLSLGLIAMNAPQHTQQRRLMMPAFHKQHVEAHRDAIVALTEAMLDGWQPGQQRDIAREMQQLTLLIVSKTLFGLDAAHESQTIDDVVQWSRLNAGDSLVRAALARLGAPDRRLAQVSERLEQRIRTLIAAKRAAPEAHADVLALLIAARDEDGAALTDDELIGQTNQLFVAGHDTTFNALTWTIFLLAQHPAVLADLVDELTAVLGGSAPTTAQLAELPLLDRVIRESMRLLPPVPFSLRRSTAPFTLGGYDLAADTLVYYSQFITHHMATLYDAPQQFRPERWASTSPSPYEYLPFSAGPRMCIGATFATLELKLVLALLLQRYRLALAPGTSIDYQVHVTLSPRHGLPMVVAAQDRRFARTEVRGTIHKLVDLA